MNPYLPYRPYRPYLAGAGAVGEAPVVTLVSIAITPAAQTIDYGSTHQFTATGTYSDASTADITGTVTWDSSNDGLATITAGGLATGTGVGTATISATLGAVSGNTTLGVIWYPAMLFANSEKGIVVEPFTLSTLYQDAAATTPVTAADDPVGYMGDQSGNNYHATQTVLGDRPAYAIDGNGKPHLRYDATDVLRFNLAAYGSTAPLSMYAVAAANTLADYCMVHSSNSMSETVQIGIGNPRGGVVRNTVAGGTAGTSGVLLAVGTVNIGLNTPTLLGHCFNGAALQAGSSGIWEKATIGAGTFADGAVSAAIGDGTTSTALNSYINYYGGVVIRRVLTAEEQNLLGAYFAGKTGCAYSSDKYAIAVGDSTIADYLGETSILGLLTSAHTEITLAVPGHTIDQQKAVFTASPKSAKMAWVVIQIGLNDLNPVEAASLAIARIQLLVNNAVLASGDPGRVFVAKMNPCKARLIILYGAIDGLVAYQKWLDINEAVMNGGATPITGVGGRISAHEPLLNDGSGNLAAAYDTGDGIHPNDAGRQIVADAWAAAIVAAGYTL